MLTLVLALVPVLELALELAAPELVLELALELVASELVLAIVTVAFAAILGEFVASLALVPFASRLDCHALAVYPVARLEIADSLAR